MDPILANIRLGYNAYPVTDSLTYYARALITAKKFYNVDNRCQNYKNGYSVRRWRQDKIS